MSGWNYSAPDSSCSLSNVVWVSLVSQTNQVLSCVNGVGSARNAFPIGLMCVCVCIYVCMYVWCDVCMYYMCVHVCIYAVYVCVCVCVTYTLALGLRYFTPVLRFPMPF